MNILQQSVFEALQHIIKLGGCSVAICLPLEMIPAYPANQEVVE